MTSRFYETKFNSRRGIPEAWIQDYFVRSREMTSVDASSWLRRWLLDPLGRIVARLADAVSRVVASRKQRRGAPDFALALQPPSHALAESGKTSAGNPPSIGDQGDHSES